MKSNDIQICIILRNFESDTSYLHFSEFFIQKINEEDKKFLNNLRHFTNHPEDNYLLCFWHHLARGEGPYEALCRQFQLKIFPLFRIMKLFKRGNLTLPFCFTYWNKKWYEFEIHGEMGKMGLNFGTNSYFLKKSEIPIFKKFQEEIKRYLRVFNIFIDPPFLKFPKKFLNHLKISSLLLSLNLAINLFLRVSFTTGWGIIEKLLDYTIGLESLYLSKRDKNKKISLARRTSFLLSNGQYDKNQIYELVKKFYQIRNDIVHGSAITTKNYEYLINHIFDYEDFLRKSILSFLDFALLGFSKRQIIKFLKKENEKLKDSLKLTYLAN